MLPRASQSALLNPKWTGRTWQSVCSGICRNCSHTPYLARPYVDIRQPKDQEAPVWMSPNQVKYANLLFAKPIAAHPVLVAQTIHNMPQTGIPQVAFVGRSNVGKSSLINALMYGKQVARTSTTPVSNTNVLKMPKIAPVSHLPGRTRHLFTFDLSNHLALIDLPGYGGAKVAKAMRMEWAILVEQYFSLSNMLRRVVSLIDGTEGPTDADTKIWDMLREKEIRFQVVLTKVDLLCPTDLHTTVLRTMALLQEYGEELLWPYIHALSAKDGLGLTEIRASLSVIASDHRIKAGEKLTLRRSCFRRPPS